VSTEKQSIFEVLQSHAENKNIREKLSLDIFYALLEHPKLQTQEFKALLIIWCRTISDFETEYQKYQENQRWFYPHGYQRLYYNAQNQMKLYCSRQDIFEQYIKDARKNRLALGEQALKISNVKTTTSIAPSLSWPDWKTLIVFASTANAAALNPIIKVFSSNTENISNSTELGKAAPNTPQVFNVTSTSNSEIPIEKNNPTLERSVLLNMRDIFIKTNGKKTLGVAEDPKPRAKSELPGVIKTLLRVIDNSMSVKGINFVEVQKFIALRSDLDIPAILIREGGQNQRPQASYLLGILALENENYGDALTFITQAILQADGKHLPTPNIDYFKELFSITIKYFSVLERGTNHELESITQTDLGNIIKMIDSILSLDKLKDNLKENYFYVGQEGKISRMIDLWPLIAKRAIELKKTCNDKIEKMLTAEKPDTAFINSIQTTYPVDIPVVALFNRRLDLLMEMLQEPQKAILIPAYDKLTIRLDAKTGELIFPINPKSYLYFIQKCYDELFTLANRYIEKGLLEKNFLSTLPQSYIKAEPTIRTMIKLIQHLIDYLKIYIDLDEKQKNDLDSKTKILAKYENLPVLWNERIGNGTPKEKLSRYLKERSKFNVYERYLPDILTHGVKYAHERGIQTFDVSTCTFMQLFQHIPPELRKYIKSTTASDLNSIAYMAGDSYNKGINGVAIDIEKAKYFFCIAASNGEAAASIWLYDYYFRHNQIHLAALLLEQSCEQSVDGHACLLVFLFYHDNRDSLAKFDQHFDENYVRYAHQAKTDLSESDLQAGLSLATSSARAAFYDIFDEKNALQMAKLSGGVIYPSLIVEPENLKSYATPLFVSAEIQSSEYQYLFSLLPHEIKQSLLLSDNICDGYLHGKAPYPKNTGLALRWARYWFFNGDLTKLRLFKRALLPSGVLTNNINNVDMIAAVMTPIGDDPQNMPHSVMLDTLEAAKQRVIEEMFALGAHESIDAAHFLAAIQAKDHHNYRLATQLILQTIDTDLDYNTAYMLVKTLVIELQMLIKRIMELKNIYSDNKQEYMLRRQQISLTQAVASSYFNSHLKETSHDATTRIDFEILLKELNEIEKTRLPTFSELTEYETYIEALNFRYNIAKIVTIASFSLLLITLVIRKILKGRTQAHHKTHQQPAQKNNKEKRKEKHRKNNEENKPKESEENFKHKKDEDKKKKYIILRNQITFLKGCLENYSDMNNAIKSKHTELADNKHHLVEAEKAHVSEATNAQKANKKWREHKKTTYDDKIKSLESEIRSCNETHNECILFISQVNKLNESDYPDEQWVEKIESLESMIKKLTSSKEKLDEWQAKNAKTQAAIEIEKKKAFERQVNEERQARHELEGKLKRFVKSPDIAQRLINTTDARLRETIQVLPSEQCDAFNKASEALTEQCYALIMLLTKNSAEMTLPELEAFIIECEIADSVLNEGHPLHQEVERQYAELQTLITQQAQAQLSNSDSDEKLDNDAESGESTQTATSKALQSEYQREPSAAEKARNDKKQAEEALDKSLGWLKNPVSLILQDFVKHANQVEKDYTQYPLIGFYSLFYSLHELQLLILTAYSFNGRTPELSIPSLFTNKSVGEFAKRFWNTMMHGFLEVDYPALLDCVRKSYCETVLVKQKPVYKLKMIHERIEFDVCQTKFWKNLCTEQDSKKYFTVQGAIERLKKTLADIDSILHSFVFKDMDRAHHQRMTPHYQTACKMLIMIIGQINQDLLFNIKGAEALRASELFKSNLESFLFRCHKKIRNLERHGANKDDENIIAQRLLDMQEDNNNRTVAFDHTSREEVEKLIYEARSIYRYGCEFNLFTRLLTEGAGLTLKLAQ